MSVLPPNLAYRQYGISAPGRPQVPNATELPRHDQIECRVTARLRRQGIRRARRLDHDLSKSALSLSGGAEVRVHSQC
jgi:hypothetical protein